MCSLDTGERMIPDTCCANVFWEHIYRYNFASKFVQNKIVVDIACGEGYGTAALEKAGALKIIGFDVNNELIRRANMKYGANYQIADADELMPLEKKSIDLIVSFETIEHLRKAECFLDECRRVLKDNGTLIVSTPNRDAKARITPNRFHFKEYSEDEFATLLKKRFTKVTVYNQHPIEAPFWNKRSLSAERSIWFHLKGSTRLRKMIGRIVCPHIYNDNIKRYRDDILGTILNKELLLNNSLLNPYIISDKKYCIGEVPYIFIAVAEC